MKQNCRRFWRFAAVMMLIAGSNVASADAYKTQALMIMDQPGAEGGALCLDSMETDPFADDLTPIPVALDGGCSIAEGTIAI